MKRRLDTVMWECTHASFVIIPTLLNRLGGRDQDCDGTWHCKPNDSTPAERRFFGSKYTHRLYESTTISLTVVSEPLMWVMDQSEGRSNIWKFFQAQLYSASMHMGYLGNSPVSIEFHKIVHTIHELRRIKRGRQGEISKDLQGKSWPCGWFVNFGSRIRRVGDRKCHIYISDASLNELSLPIQCYVHPLPTLPARGSPEHRSNPATSTTTRQRQAVRLHHHHLATVLEERYIDLQIRVPRNFE